MLRADYQPKEELKVGGGVYKTGILGLLYIDRPVYHDERGFFLEVANLKEIAKVTGSDFVPVQVNHSRSVTNTIRGMHAEGWNKLVHVASGLAFCALTDVRPESATFRVVEQFRLGAEPGALPGALFLEKGIANSICAINGPVDYIYLVDRLYGDRDKSGDRAISVFDPDLAIKWPVDQSKMIISQRDKDTVTLRQLFPDKFHE